MFAELLQIEKAQTHSQNYHFFGFFSLVFYLKMESFQRFIDNAV